VPVLEDAGVKKRGVKKPLFGGTSRGTVNLTKADIEGDVNIRQPKPKPKKKPPAPPKPPEPEL
jgi:hypothetical protein